MREYKLINGDLLNANTDFICHQVNCQGKMNSGVAKAIRNKWRNKQKGIRFIFRLM